MNCFSEKTEYQQDVVLDENIVEQSALELTQRLGDELGLVETYVSTIRYELDMLSVSSPSIDKRLGSIAHAARAVLDLNIGLKNAITFSQELWEERSIVSPRELFEHVQSSFSLPRTIQLSVSIDEDVTEVFVFEKLIDDALRYLVSNALDAMPAGGMLALAARRNGHMIALTVHDTGTGIPAYKQDKIFALFYSTKGNPGLGLWNARRNALLNQGSLTVESRVGSGSVFTLLLPCAEDALHQE